MKTKTLLIAAAALAAGIMQSQAQVYSQNIVGYVNATIPASGFGLIANPLTTGNDVLTNVITASMVPNNTVAWIYSGGTYTSYTKHAAGFGASAAAVNAGPGHPFFLQNVATTNITVTFVGNVLTGTNLLPCVAGYNLVSSQVPITGLVKTQLGLPAVNHDYIWQFNPLNTPQYVQYNCHIAGFSPEPTIGTNTLYGVCEGFFYYSSAGATTWTNIFNP